MSIAKWAGVGLVVGLGLVGWYLLAWKTAFARSGYQHSLQAAITQQNTSLKVLCEDCFYSVKNSERQGESNSGRLFKITEGSSSALDSFLQNLNNLQNTDSILNNILVFEATQKNVLEKNLQKINNLNRDTTYINWFFSEFENISQPLKKNPPAFLQTALIEKMGETGKTLKKAEHLPIIAWKDALFSTDYNQTQTKTSLLLVESQQYRNLFYINDNLFGRSMLECFGVQRIRFHVAPINNPTHKSKAYCRIVPTYGFLCPAYSHQSANLDSVWINNRFFPDPSTMFNIPLKGVLTIRARYKHPYTGATLFYSDTLVTPK